MQVQVGGGEKEILGGVQCRWCVAGVVCEKEKAVWWCGV